MDSRVGNEERRRRVQPERLLHHRLQVLEVGDVGLPHHALGADDGVELRLELPHGVRVLEEFRHRPLDRPRCGVRARCKHVLHAQQTDMTMVSHVG